MGITTKPGKHNPNIDEIREVLKRFPYGAATAQIASILDMGTEELEARLQIMAHAGYVKTQGQGLWLLVKSID